MLSSGGSYPSSSSSSIRPPPSATEIIAKSLQKRISSVDNNQEVQPKRTKLPPKPLSKPGDRKGKGRASKAMEGD